MPGMDAPPSERIDDFQRGFDIGSETHLLRDCLVFFAGFGTAFFFAAL